VKSSTATRLVMAVAVWGVACGSLWAADAKQETSTLPLSGITGDASPESAPASSDAASAEEAATPLAPTPHQVAAKPLSQQERLRSIVDLSFTNANLKNVLNSLAKAYGLNIIAGDNITGTVNMTLRGVTLEEGLRQILKLNGFGFTVKAGIIEVARPEEKRVAEVLHLKYLSPDIALEFIQPLAGEKAVLKVDEPSNAILVSDFLNKIEQMRSVLEAVDQPPQQVLIESRILDVRHTDLDNLGMKLENIANTIPLHPSRGTSETIFPLVISSGSVSLPGPNASTTMPAGQFIGTGAIGDDTLKATIDALIQNKRVKVIANPSVMTLNNVEAKITIGEKFPIREQTQTSTGTLETTRFVDAGTTLRVTPKINRDGFIQLHIHPEVSSVSDATLSAGPRITTREADTTVIVRDGQSIVIAGLIQDDETLVKGKIPILSSIPIVGLLFQNRSKSNEQKELVVMITPHIVELPDLKLAPGLLEQTATRIGGGELLNEAQAIEESRTLKAQQMPSTVRWFEAVHLYQRAVEAFPHSPFAMEALWHIGRLERNQLHDLDAAEVAFQQLLEQFPDGPYAGRAQWNLKGIRRELAHRRIRSVKAEVSAAKGAPAPASPAPEANTDGAAAASAEASDMPGFR